VQLETHVLTAGVARVAFGLRIAGATWIEVLFPPVTFKARLYPHSGFQAVRTEVPFVLGWADNIHLAQNLPVSEAALDLAECFEPGMVNTATSRVAEKASVFITSLNPSRTIFEPLAFSKYRDWMQL